MAKRIVTSVKNHFEAPIKPENLANFKEMAARGREPQEIKEKAYIYSTVDYPVPVQYTNGESITISPKGKELVDASLIDKSALKKGLILRPV
jgi:hypothetical protein